MTIKIQPPNDATESEYVSAVNSNLDELTMSFVTFAGEGVSFLIYQNNEDEDCASCFVSKEDALHLAHYIINSYKEP